MSSKLDSTALTPLELKEENQKLITDSSLFQKQREFFWPDQVKSQDELQEPLIDLQGFFNGDEAATMEAAELVRTACLSHGFFQVTNHGVDAGLIQAVYNESDAIFGMPLSKKLSIHRKSGCINGYSRAHAERFSSMLPWNETFSFGYNAQDSEPKVVNYLKSVMGDDYEQSGWVYQKYCESMMKLYVKIMELLAISLGVDRLEYRNFFEDGGAILRSNYYPPCKEPGLTFGTGPHCDPNSLTILHQDQVGGLQVFSDGKWQAVRPRPDALVVNIGDTFMALSNGRYKSCLHRAVVNKEKERRSLAFFAHPKQDKVVRPLEPLIANQGPRKYPDFTWSDMLEFTQKHYRVDGNTLQNFIPWFLSSRPCTINI